MCFYFPSFGITYIVRIKASILLDEAKYPGTKRAVEELESRIDQAIQDLL